MGTRFKRPSRLHSFPRLLLAEWRRLKLPTNETVIVAVSGGADSTSLLLALDELNKAQKTSLTICVAHLDHGIRPNSKEDARWVRNLAKQLGLKSVIERADTLGEASSTSQNLEQVARSLRYEFLERTATRLRSRFVLSGHTMDDQAETVLLRLIRGSAGEGLSGIHALRPISKGSRVTLVRTLLWARRSQTEDYCRARKTEFLHDEMNDDERFARVKIRKQLLPLMQQVNRKVVEALSRTASLLKEDGTLLVSQADLLLKKATENGSTNPETNAPPLNVDVLLGAPPALRRRALRQWIAHGRGDARRLEMVHLLTVEKLLEGNKGGRLVELPNGSRVRRKRGWLEFEAKND
jgi:tRNA(Ile)-lysidine synthase